MKKTMWDLMKEDAKDTARKKGDYTELAELKKVERDAEKRMGYTSKLDRLVKKHSKPEPILDYIERVKKGDDPFRYEGWHGKTTHDEPNALPKDLQFSKILPLPPIKKKPAINFKLEPLPMDVDLLEEQNKIYFDSVLDKEDVKPKKETGIAGLLKLK